MRLSTFHRIQLAALLVLGLAFAGPAHAADTPPTLAGATLVNAQEVAKLQAAGAVVIDARVASEYSEGHIKGAVSIPYREKSAKDVGFDQSQDEWAVDKLPADKKASIVLYCNGPECWKSYKSSVAAIKAGYSNIHWFRGGFPEWKAAGLASD
ncbi:MAG TPA: rhodanese-like domain-containing protein [Stellaceae bacterium]|nr:rhodanese-like domain-containing protein [Stellaceae bacterium]